MIAQHRGAGGAAGRGPMGFHRSIHRRRRQRARRRRADPCRAPAFISATLGAGPERGDAARRSGAGRCAQSQRSRRAGVSWHFGNAVTSAEQIDSGAVIPATRSGRAGDTRSNTTAPATCSRPSVARPGWCVPATSCCSVPGSIRRGPRCRCRRRSCRFSTRCSPARRPATAHQSRGHRRRAGPPSRSSHGCCP